MATRLSRIIPALILGLSLAATPCAAQSTLLREFRDCCDSLSVLVRERTGVEVKLKLKSVNRRENNIDFNFTQTLGDIPWMSADVEWFRETLEDFFPEKLSGCKVGRLLANGTGISSFVLPPLHNDGRAHSSNFSKMPPAGTPLVRGTDAKKYSKGLSGRHLAIWQSHGRYYEASESRWEWQRARNFMTVEDMFTQSFVLPYLIPMLENAGAYVLDPRERDIQRHEAVVDNDAAFSGERSGMTRRSGEYAESGNWSDAGTGFADAKRQYVLNENPFTMGSARKCRVRGSGEPLCSASWTPDITEAGRYAVYISYKTLENSTCAAHYTVRHMAGETSFSVNQTMGGGTWIYLGTFDFAPDSGNCVILDNGVPEGGIHSKGEVVTADAVRFGGGMGKIARGNGSTPDNIWATSGLPAYAEGALYSMQWAGVDSTITRKHDNDYTNDFADRGPWVAMMSGGSSVNPKTEGKRIPIDLCLAFHSDAGTHPNDSLVGTLGIYTLKNEGSRRFPDGGDRSSSRTLSHYVQSQVVGDIHSLHEGLWPRRETSDRSYSESRTPDVPAMILELLSHQNFADMKYGHDPEFKFNVSRAVYKGVLKFLSDRYGVPYMVQPLPVKDFSATVLQSGKVRLCWKATADSLEPTAVPEGFIIQTRVDDGVFDSGRPAEAMEMDGEYSCFIPIEAGHIYSFRVIAENEGGRSFPSETLAAGMPAGCDFKKNILIVNNFTRVAPPAWFDTPEYAGFNTALDAGVPCIRDISYIGEMYQFRRDLPWEDDDNPGFGASHTDKAGIQPAGNSFDYPYLHGKAVLASGRAFSSASREAFLRDSTLAAGHLTIDLICGKQVTTPGSTEPLRFSIFPEGMRKALKRFSSRGGNLLVSGANIGTDLWDRVYPVEPDSLYQAEGRRFAEQVLGFTRVTDQACNNGTVKAAGSEELSGIPDILRYRDTMNEEAYWVGNPDGIKPSDSRGGIFLRYADTDISAGIWSRRSGYSTVCLGFPLETICSVEDLNALMKASLDFLEGQD